MSVPGELQSVQRFFCLVLKMGATVRIIPATKEKPETVQNTEWFEVITLLNEGPILLGWSVTWFSASQWPGALPFCFVNLQRLCVCGVFATLSHRSVVLLTVLSREFRLSSQNAASSRCLYPPWSSRRKPAVIGSFPMASGGECHLQWCLQEMWTPLGGSLVWRRPLTENTACAPPAVGGSNAWTGMGLRRATHKLKGESHGWTLMNLRTQRLRGKIYIIFLMDVRSCFWSLGWSPWCFQGGLINEDYLKKTPEFWNRITAKQDVAIHKKLQLQW